MQIQALAGAPPSIGQRPETRHESKEEVAKAAGDFEALMISQLLRSARGGGEGWMGTGGDQSASSVLEMAEEQLAQAMARSGGMGLARMVIQGLNATTGARPEAGKRG